MRGADEPLPSRCRGQPALDDGASSPSPVRSAGAVPRVDAEILLSAHPERVARQPLEAEASMRVLAQGDDAHVTMLPVATLQVE